MVQGHQRLLSISWAGALALEMALDIPLVARRLLTSPALQTPLRHRSPHSSSLSLTQRTITAIHRGIAVSLRPLPRLQATLVL